jgi:hypothetical protein
LQNIGTHQIRCHFDDCLFAQNGVKICPSVGWLVKTMFIGAMFSNLRSGEKSRGLAKIFSKDE